MECKLDALSLRHESIRIPTRFRWAALQIESLKRLRVLTQITIERTLEALPIGLNASYHRLLSQIDHSLVYEAALALKWLVGSARPLQIDELIDACIIHPDRIPCAQKRERLDPESLLDMLYGFATTEAPKTEVMTLRLPEEMCQ